MKKKLAEIFAENIFRYRTQLGLSQAKLAALVDVEPGSILRWEKGEAIPRGDAPELLAAIFKINASELYLDKDQSELDQYSMNQLMATVNARALLIPGKVMELAKHMDKNAWDAVIKLMNNSLDVQEMERKILQKSKTKA